MPKVFTSKTQKKGEIGENIAARFLVKQGYAITERNYTKKWGEIDIIAQKDKKLYFAEVKSVARADLEGIESKGQGSKDEYRPEDNMHPWKAKRLSRTIQTYLLSKNIPEDKEWEVMLVLVYLDLEHKKAKVKIIQDVIL